MSTTKKVSLLFIALLFIWFCLDITGLSINGVIIVVSAFYDEPIDIVFLIAYGVIIYTFIFHEKFGKWIMSIFLIAWGLLQGIKYFDDDFTSYYDYFEKEGTHRLLPESDSFLIKDTYHIILDILVIITLTASLVFLFQSYNKRKQLRTCKQRRFE